MRQEELKEALQKITMTPEMKEKLLLELNSKNSRKPKQLAWRKLKIAVCFLLVTGLFAIPVKAVVQSLVTQRMEQVPVEEINNITKDLNQSDKNADTFSREFTKEEEVRLNDLYKEYSQGKFPTEEITKIASDKEVDPEKICFISDTQTYYFPNREMTDEELLEYIDWTQKQSYALEQNLDGEIKKGQEEKDKEEREEIQTIQKSGGIDKAEASRLGGEWMQKLFDEDINGMETNCYLTGTGEVEEEIASKYPKVYMSYYGTMHNHYYFYLDAITGTLVTAEHSTAGIWDNTPIELLQDNMKLNLESARDILEKQIGIHEKFTHIYCGYGVTEDNQINSGILSFHFVTNENTDYIVKVRADNQELVIYYDTYFVDEEQTKKKLDELKELLKKSQEKDYKEVTHYRIEVGE